MELFVKGWGGGKLVVGGHWRRGKWGDLHVRAKGVWCWKSTRGFWNTMLWSFVWETIPIKTHLIVQKFAFLLIFLRSFRKKLSWSFTLLTYTFLFNFTFTSFTFTSTSTFASTPSIPRFDLIFYNSIFAHEDEELIGVGIQLDPLIPDLMLDPLIHFLDVQDPQVPPYKRLLQYLLDTRPIFWHYR